MHKEVAHVDEQEVNVDESAFLSLPSEREAEGSFVERGTEGSLNTGSMHHRRSWVLRWGLLGT